MGLWGNPSVIPEIANALPSLDEPGQIAAIEALGKISNKEALDVLDKYTDNPSVQIRKASVVALSRIDNTGARDRLKIIADNDEEEWLRKLAARKLKSTY